MQCMLGTNSHERVSPCSCQTQIKKRKEKKNCLQQLRNCAHYPGCVNMEESKMFVVPAMVYRRQLVCFSDGSTISWYGFVVFEFVADFYFPLYIYRVK